MGAASKVASVGGLSSSDGHLKEISQEAKIDSEVVRKCCDLDYDLEISTGEPLPICVFGGAPTLQQAQAATSEIKDALALERINGKGSTEIKPNDSRNIILRLNKLFEENPKFQSAVASIASDQNVWDAMMKNPAINEYTMRWNKKSTIPSLKMISSVTEFVGGLDFIRDETLKNSSLFDKLRDRVKDLLQNIRTQVVGMVGNITKRLSNIFGTSPSADHPSAESSSIDDYIGSAAFCALMVIVFLVFKYKI